MRKKIDALRVRVLGSPVAVMLMLAPFLRPWAVGQISPVLDWTLAGWKILVTLLVAAFFLARPRLSAATAAVGAYYAIVLLSTAVNHSDKGIYYVLTELLISVGVLCVMLDIALTTDPAALLKGLLWYLGAVCLINLATVVLTKLGIGYFVGKNNYYLLGYDNTHSFFILPPLTAGLLLAWRSRRSLAAQAGLIALMTVSLYITWTASGVVGASVFIVLFVLYRVKNSWRVCNVGVYYGAVAVLFLLVVVLRVTNWFSFLFEDVLHKDITLTGRIPIWEASFPYILSKPILGSGLYAQDTMRAMVGNVNCHSMYLQIPFDTGAVGSAVYLAALGLLVRPLMRTRESFGGYILAAALFAFLVILEVESLVWPLPFYVLYMLCYHAEDITAALDPDRGEKEEVLP